MLTPGSVEEQLPGEVDPWRTDKIGQGLERDDVQFHGGHEPRARYDVIVRQLC
jgi:hypothetical protein